MLCLGEKAQKEGQHNVPWQQHSSMRHLWPIVILTGVLAGHCDRAPEQPCIFSSLPDEIDTEARYLFYLHGRIIEDKGMRPNHPTFGVYEYEKILNAFADSGFCVISETRSRGAAIEQSAQRLVAQIRTLLKGGVDGRHISVVGFSKGGVIALRANTLLADERISFVILAGCSRQVVDKLDLTPAGRVLSIFDANDNIAGSCARLFERSGRHLTHHEVELSVERRPGHGHGVFYRPLDAWLSPVVRWMRQDGREPGPGADTDR
jgi:hypothetical protein